jgi:hypothetical protein
VSKFAILGFHDADTTEIETAEGSFWFEFGFGGDIFL